MTDTQVMEFCEQGFVVLEGIVPYDVNERTLEFLDAFYATQPPDLPERTATIPTDLLIQDWYRDNVTLHPHVAGIVRSLLGRDFKLPSFLSNHRVKCPMPAEVPGQTSHRWHRDGAGGGGDSPMLNHVDFSSLDSREGAQNCMQVFYYPQDVPLELGPTELVPGTHLLDSVADHVDGEGNVPSSHHKAAPAGSITITTYCIWHRRTASTGEGIRNNLKYKYARTVSPWRDWVIEPGVEVPGPGDAPGDHSEGTGVDATDMFAWLCGREPWAR